MMKGTYECAVYDQGREPWSIGQPWDRVLLVRASGTEEAMQEALETARREAIASHEYDADAYVHVRVIDEDGRELARGYRAVYDPAVS